MRQFLLIAYGLSVGMMAGWLGWDVCWPLFVALIAIMHITRHRAPAKPRKFIPTNIGQCRDGNGRSVNPLIIAAVIAGSSHSGCEGGNPDA